MTDKSNKKYVPEPIRAAVAAYEKNCPIRFRAEKHVSWQTLAQNKLDQFDDMCRRDIQREIGYAVANRVTTEKLDYEDTNGRIYRGELFAMGQWDFWELLYHVYSAGQSEGIKRSSSIELVK